MTPDSRAVGSHTYIGLFLTTLVTLMYEILLTRIFSVTMWYHFVFMAISIAMFGMTVGAIAVYFAPKRWTETRFDEAMGISALFFGVSILVCLILESKAHLLTNSELKMVSISYGITSVPFFLSGICVCIALTKLPQESIGKLYAADLIGASLGCILFIFLIRLAGGPALIPILACLATVSSVFILWRTKGAWKRIAIVLSLALAVASVAHTILTYQQKPFLRITWSKGTAESPTIWEKWNSFSRIRISADNEPSPFGWGFSRQYPFRQDYPRELNLEIDSAAGTVLTQFDGAFRNLDYLGYDIVNIGHYIRPASPVLIVGVGGGRDILSALLFQHPRVVGVEINDQILEAVNGDFGNFTGHLDRYPAVSFVNDEARSFLAREQEKFGLIQVSMIDTWAATAAGAFVLAENALYTTDAWEIFLSRLQPGGILSFSRWYSRDQPAEMYRLTTLAAASLRNRGFTNPRGHIIIVRTVFPPAPLVNEGIAVGTLLVSNRPFSDRDLAELKAICEKLKFVGVLTPQGSTDSVFERITDTTNYQNFVENFPLDITAPSDNRPFFFNMLRLKTALQSTEWSQGVNNINMMAVYYLEVLLILVIVLTLVFVILPLAFTVRISHQKGVLPYVLFFAAIGWGFMLVELSQMQRLIIFLGHPTYSLSVVLFSLLLSGGIGSYTTQGISEKDLFRRTTIRLLLLLLLLLLQGLLTPYCAKIFASAATWQRILIAVILLLPAGFFMGMAFPLGMQTASFRLPEMRPWFWGINGAMTICASVVSMVIAIGFGVSASFWTGFAFYLVAFVSLLGARSSYQPT